MRDFRQAATIDVPTRAIIENEAQPESLMPDPFALSVTFHVKPEHAEEFGARVKENVSETRKDEGVITFNFHKVIGEPIWILYEIWESEHHSDVHRQKPDVVAFFAQWERLLARPPQIHQLEPSP